MIEHGSKVMCLICKTSITAKTYNISRHCETKHKAQVDKMSKEARILFVKEKKSDLKSISIKKHLNRNQIVSKVSFKIVHMLLKKQKPFSEAPFIKECLQVAMEEILIHHRDKQKIMVDINNIQLSRQTATRRTEIIGEVIQLDIKSKLESALSVSICLDESTDINDVSQLVVFCRIVCKNFEVFDEIIGLFPLKSTTTAKDIKHGIDEILKKMAISPANLTAITTDGAASMVGKRNGLVALMKKDNPKLISLQCIIHQENLLAKSGIAQAKPFADTVMKIINKCIAAGATRHRQFREFLKEYEAETDDLHKMQQVRWLSTEKTFSKLLPVSQIVKEFLQGQGIHFEELDDPQWIQDLSFFTDLTAKLGELNRKLQGKQKFVWKSYKDINLFKTDLESLIEEFDAEIFETFPNLNENFLETGYIAKQKYIDWLKLLHSDFDRRFQDFKSIVDLLNFGESIRESSVQVIKEVSVKFDINYEQLRNDFIDYKSQLALVEDDNLKILGQFSALSLALSKVMSIFADSYLCESSFSKMNFILNEFRSRLTQQHLESCLIVACSAVDIDFDDLALNYECRVSN